MRRFWTAGALAALAMLVTAAPASASRTMESIFEDDHQLLQLGDSERNRALDEFERLGADTVRSLVYWNQLVPGPRSKRRPKGFDPRDPAAYPAHLWDRYDDLVRGARARGLDVLLSPSGPLPAWASGCTGGYSERRSCKPEPAEFRKFVQALGRRYSGTYADENQGGVLLPRVGRWSVWNEPNQPGWLSPQYVKRGRHKVAFAAHRYRALAKAAIRGLRRSGHRRDQLLLGETAPIGRTTGRLATRPIPPVEFVRELFCLDRRGRRQRGSAARRTGCRRPGRLAVTGFAHHPYTRGGSQPPRARTLPGEITVSTAGRLKKLLRQGERAGRIPRRLPIFYTEFGYQSNPPDRLFGVPLAKQAEYLNESDWIAYRDRRVRSVAQYKLIDEADVASFQTGLRFFDGSAKPAYDAYRLPIWVSRRGSSRVRVYGQVRPGVDRAPLAVEVQNDAGGRFETVQLVTVTSRKGHFTVDLPARAGKWRLRWDGHTSRQAEVARR